MEKPQIARDKSPLCSLSPSSVIINEIVTIVTAIRKLARWKSSGFTSILRLAISENEFLPDGFENQWRNLSDGDSEAGAYIFVQFAQLKSDLTHDPDVTSYDACKLLDPFLDILKDSSMVGFITSLAITAIMKFFSYGIINENSPNLAFAIRKLSNALTQCRFENTEDLEDEAVLLKILRLMEQLLRFPGSILLSDDSVCEMVETALAMCCQRRLSDSLRRSASLSLSSMIECIFTRLHSLDPSTDDGTVFNEATKKTEETELSDEAMLKLAPYGINSVREVFRVLITFVELKSTSSSEVVKLMALCQINTALEIAGSKFADFPSLRILATDYLCKGLLRLIRSNQVPILSAALRVMVTLLQTMREHLKLQQELFLTYILSCLQIPKQAIIEEGVDPAIYNCMPYSDASSSFPNSLNETTSSERSHLRMLGNTPEVRELFIECLDSLTRIPSYITDLYVNYDCDIRMANICQNLIETLSKNAFSNSALYSTPNVPPLSFSALLNAISFIHGSLVSPAANLSNTSVNAAKMEELMDNKMKKEIITEGCLKFNEKPEAGILFLLENKIIQQPGDASCIAKFLHSTNRIDKRVLGEFLTKSKNLIILDKFISFFNFTNIRIDEALRLMLQSFRLPGESQLIERILEFFAHYYLECNKQFIASKDAVFVLSYSIIMLNTDQHNPNIKAQKRMTLDDFRRNIRGINDGKDFDQDFLKQVYTSIRENEIIIVEEHDTETSFNYFWHELQRKTTEFGPFVCNHEIKLNVLVFKAFWRPMVSALMYVFFTATKDTVYQHVINGIHQCVTIASQVSLFDTIDFIVGRLSHIVLLSIGSFPRRTFSTTVNYNEASIKVNDATVAIGRDFRAQLAVILLFWIFNKFASSMRYGMQDLFSVLSCLVQENVIEGDCLPTFPFTKTCYFPIPDTTSKKNKSGKESGILSTFSSFLAGYSSENEPTPTETEVEYSLCAADCLKSSKLRECLLNFPTHINNAAAEWLFNTFITITENSERVVPLFISNSLILIETDVDTLRYQFCDEVLISLPIEILTSICLQCPQDYQPYAVKLLMFISQEITRIPAATCHLFSCASALISFKCVSIAEGSMVCRIMDSMLAKLASTNLLAVKPIRHSLLQICENTTVLQKTESFTRLCIQLADQLGTSEEIVPLFEQVCITALPRELYEQFLSSITNSVRKMSKAITATILEHKRSNARNKTLDKEVIDQHAKSVSDLLQLFASTSTMLNTVTKINEEDEAEAENLARWKILYKNLRRLCTSQGKTVRATSLTVLQQIIMKQLDAEHDVGVTLLLFDEILVPILQDMMKYSPPRHEGRMMGQAQALMFNILCKTLLIDMTLLSSDSNALPSLWVRVMELSCSLYQLNKSEPLTEVTESLKNVHLILTSAGYIKQSETGELQTTDTALKEQWNSTWKRLLTCFPELTEELKPAKTDIPNPEKTDPSNDS